jgi:hypothetical protein
MTRRMKKLSGRLVSATTPATAAGMCSFAVKTWMGISRSCQSPPHSMPYGWPPPAWSVLKAGDRAVTDYKLNMKFDKTMYFSMKLPVHM